VLAREAAGVPKEGRLPFLESAHMWRCCDVVAALLKSAAPTDVATLR
jgi:hypothetical protein